MENQFINHIGYEEITDIISVTKELLIISLPNIHNEICHSILSYQKENNIKEIKIILDNNEHSYRNGFGEIDAVENLKSNGIQVFELGGNLVSFIISDELGFYLFPHCRIFSEDKEITSNAVLIDPVSLIRLKNYFFPDITNKNKEEISNQVIDSFNKAQNFMNDTIEEYSIEKKYKADILKNEKIKDVKQKLKNNPPLHPDLQRQIKTYTAKVQFVELTFEGANLHTKDVKIPPKALPFKDENIRRKLNTKMKLFSKMDEKKGFESFIELKGKIEKIRTNYLQPLTYRKDKSVINIEDKESFENEIKSISDEIPVVNAKIKDFIKKEILNSKKQIQKELHDFLIENPPEYLKDYKDNLLKESIEDEVNKIINHIKFPEPDNILSKVSIKINFYDLTFEDFKDEKLLDEFADKGIMNSNDIESILKIKQAFEVKK